MADKETRMVDDGGDNTRFGYQPKDPKKVGAGYKPKADPTPANPPSGKKSDDGSSNAKEK